MEYMTEVTFKSHNTRIWVTESVSEIIELFKEVNRCPEYMGFVHLTRRLGHERKFCPVAVDDISRFE